MAGQGPAEQWTEEREGGRQPPSSHPAGREPARLFLPWPRLQSRDLVYHFLGRRGVISHRPPPPAPRQSSARML